jgi:hypothetical protein
MKSVAISTMHSWLEMRRWRPAVISCEELRRPWP